MIAALASLGGLLLSLIAFLAGKSIGESEKILAEKRRVYEAFLMACPKPNDTYSAGGIAAFNAPPITDLIPVLLLYAPPNVALAFRIYVRAFEEASEALSSSSEALHPAYVKAAQSHNDLILEMRRDAFSWSAFGYSGKTRLPLEALQPDNRN